MRIYVLILVAALGLIGGGIALAQMEDGDRGILPRDTAQVLEVSGITVNVAGEDADDARYNGWRIAQREGWAKLWAQTTGRDADEAPSLSDSTLDMLVNAVVVEREQIGPERYIATLGIQFDRARTGERLGISTGRRRSTPVLLIPVTLTGGTATAVDTRNPWQRAWAQFRTGDSDVDYVRVSGLGVDPLLVNAAVTRRPGTDWWTNVADLYGVTNFLIAEVTVHRLYPGGPAEARFVARVGRDREVVGRFGLRVQNGDDIDAMMAEGARQMDELFQNAFRRGKIRPDQDIFVERAPPPVEEEEVVAEQRQIAPSAYQLRVYATSAGDLGQALGAVRAVPGVQEVSELSVAIGAISNVRVTYRGDVSALRAALLERGWYSTYVGGVLQIQRGQIDNPTPSPPQPTSPPPRSPEQPEAPEQPEGMIGRRL